MSTKRLNVGLLTLKIRFYTLVESYLTPASKEYSFYKCMPSNVRQNKNIMVNPILVMSELNCLKSTRKDPINLGKISTNNLC